MKKTLFAGVMEGFFVKWIINGIYKLILVMIHFLENVGEIIYKIVGLEKVSFNGESGSIFEIIFLNKDLKNVALGIIGIAIFLFFCMSMYTSFSVIISEKSEERGRKFFKGLLKSVLTFTLLPTIVFVTIFSVNVIGSEIQKVKFEDGNFKSISSYIIGSGIDDSCYKNSNKEETISAIKADGYSWQSMDKNLNMENYNIWYPLIFGLLITLPILRAMVTLSGRVFYIVFLTITAPIIITRGAKDDDDGFNRWIEDYLNSFLSGLILVFSINFLFFCLGIIQKITFFPSNNTLNNISIAMFSCGAIIFLPNATKAILRQLELNKQNILSNNEEVKKKPLKYLKAINVLKGRDSERKNERLPVAKTEGSKNMIVRSYSKRNKAGNAEYLIKKKRN